jgi:hypothetical protein
MAKKKRGKRRGRRPGVAGLSLAQLEGIIARRKAAQAKGLKAQRAKIAKQLAALDEEIAALTGAAPRRGPGRPKAVVRKKRGRAKKVAAKGRRMRSTAGQIARVQKAILKALKGNRAGLLKLEITKAVKSRPQTLNTALKKLLTAKKVTTKGVTRNMRYLAA